MNNNYLISAFRIVMFLLLINFNAKSQIVINEICPSNISVIKNSTGEYDDWFELHNNSTSPFNLNGYGLTDDPLNKFAFTFPNYSVPAGGKVLVFASGKNNDVVVNHWEMGVDGHGSWNYKVGVAGMDTNWRNPSFSSGAWPLNGNGGVGFADGDDGTIVSTCVSVMMRKTFTITDTSQILKMVLMMDYDDGFVAYLNGVEIARANVGVIGMRPLWNDIASASHEANVYQGLPIDSFYISPKKFKSILRLGTNANVLAIETHNNTPTGSDLTSIPYLMFGMANSGSTYMAKPSWFVTSALDYYNANFKLSRSGETLYIYNPSGAVVDQKTYPAMQPNNSLGRKPDGSSTWCFAATPSPNLANTFVCYTGYANVPIFSKQGGYYSSTSVSLTNSTPGGVIRYTTNGNEPTTSSPIYSSSISLSSSKVVRAKVYASGYLPSPTVTNSYFINVNTHLPTFAITTDSSNLWDWNTGIYVMGPGASATSPYFGANFWQDWEKPASIEFYDKNKNLVTKFNADIKIYGNYSRAKAQKSFEIKLSDKNGLGSFNYQMYWDKPWVNNVSNIILRNSGTDWNKVHFRDGYMERMLRNTYTGYLAANPTIAFLNGAYWGVYCINENHDHHWMKDNFGLGKSEIDYLKEGGGYIGIQEGTDALFWQMYNDLTTQNPATQAYYDNADNKLDLKNFTDYMVAETFYNNGDWIGPWTNNIQLWRPNANGGKWRYLLYDTDFGMNLKGTVNDDRLEMARNPVAFSFLSEMFDQILKNPTYKRYFINRYCDLMNTIFLYNNMDAEMHSFKDTMSYDMPPHFAKWGSTTSSWNTYISDMMSFANQRPGIMKGFIKTQFALTKKVTLTLKISPAGAGRIEISTITPTTYPWTGDYFDGNPVTITAIPNPGFTFDHWKSTINITTNNPNQALTVNFTGNDQITAYFTGAATPVKVCVSELNYNSSSTLDASDWVELHNYATTPIDISGWTLSDGNNNHKFKIRTGTVLPANGYLVLSEDTIKFKSKFPTVNFQGPIGFNYSNAGDQLRLFDNSDNVYLSFTYQDIAPWPITPDGGGYTLELQTNTSNPNTASSWFAGCLGGSPGRAYSGSLNANLNISGNTSFCSGQSVTLSATSNPNYSYQWKNGGVNIPGATNNSLVVNQTGSYSVFISSQGCSSETTPTVVSVVTQHAAPVATDSSRCGAGVLSLTASANDTVFWYDSNSGGTLLGFGDTLNTNNLNNTTNFYARTGRTCQSPSTLVHANIIPVCAAPVASNIARCGPGPVTLVASDTAAVRWFNQSSSGGLLASGQSFTTGVLNNDTSYFVEAGSVCPSGRVEVFVTVNTAPAVTVHDTSRCGNGTMVMQGSSPFPVSWYQDQFGGAPLGFGPQYTTPFLAVTDTFYAEAVNGGCASVRQMAIANVFQTPVAPTVIDTAICTTTSGVTLNATATEIIRWYNAPSGGTLLFTGSNYITPPLSNTTVYYIEDGYYCPSSRAQMTVTVSSPAAAPSATDVARCGTGSVTLYATSPELIYWFDAPTLGNQLAISDFYTTPSLSVTTTYYAEAGTFCRSLTRTAAKAIINPGPLAPTASNATLCGPGSTTLIANSPDTVYWYSVPSGGSPIAFSAAFTTPLVSTTTTFYVEAANNCRSARTPVQVLIASPPSSPVVSNGSICGGGVVSLSATSTNIVQWYTVPSGGVPISTGSIYNTPSISNSVTYYVEAVNGCSSTRVPAIATVNSIPNAPTTSGVTRCGPGTVTFGASSPEQIFWYTVASGGSSVSTGTTYTTPSISTTTTYYVETGNICRSNRIPVVATVGSALAAPTTTGASSCIAGSLTLTASSPNLVNWFTVPSGGTVLTTGTSYTTPSISTTTTYYVEATNGTCSSNRIPVVAAITGIPNAPATTNNSRCGNGTVSLSATGSGTINWYNTSSGGTILGSGTSFTTASISATTTYYAEVSANGCTSSRIAAVAIVNAIPAPPTTSNVSNCGAASLALTATSPEQVYWYAVPNGGSSISTGSSYTTPVISSTTTYYVETGNTCRSLRIPVIAQIISSPAAPVLTGGSICGSGTVTLTASSSNPVSWYNVPSGGSAISTNLTYTTPVILATTTYYAEAGATGCMSTRVAVVASVNSVPNAPTASGNSRCGPGTLTLTATGSGQLYWYTSSTGGILLDSGAVYTTSSLTSSVTYYVETRNGACKSIRSAATATIIQLPASPTTANVNRCGPGTLTLTASSPEQIYWYSVASGGAPIATGPNYTTPSISSTTTYYVEAGNNCRSLRIPVQAIITINAISPTVTDGNRCGTGTVSLAASSNLPISWYTAPTGGIAIGTGATYTTPSISSTTTYYAEAGSSGCTSARVPVVAIVNSLPPSPTGTGNSICGAGSVMLTATAVGQMYWYTAASGGIALDSGAVFNTPNITTTKTYYVETRNGTCISARTAVIATITSLPAAPAANNGNRCGAGTVTLTASSPEQIYWYTAASGGSPVGTGPVFTTATLSSTTTYYVETGNNCRSVRIPVQAIVSYAPNAPALTSASRCGVGAVTLSGSSPQQIYWYTVPVGGIFMNVGTTYTTPAIATTTTYYAESGTPGCMGPRTAVVATINPLPTAPIGTNGFNCINSSVALSASASGQLYWYASVAGGNILDSGVTYNTPNISVTTTYYVETRNGTCSSNRTPVVASISSPAAAPTVTNANRCGTGTLTLSASSPEQIYWYSVPSGGTPIATGSTYTTPTISTTTTYYVEAGNSCHSVRVPIQAIISSSPNAPALFGGSNCGPGSITLTGTSTLLITWYDVPSGGSPIGTGTSFSTPTISSTTTYYAEAGNSGCTSVRVAVQAIILNQPAAPVVTSNSNCGPGSIALSATGSGQLYWYTAQTGGTLLDSGATYNTGVLNSTATFYVGTTNGTCTSVRTAAVATILTVPPVPSANNVSGCGAGPVTLTASSAETIYWYSTPSGGILLGTGPTYTTSSISSTTTYYVETGNNCRSARIPVLAIISTPPNPPTLTDTTICGSSSAVLHAISSSQVNWFDVPTGGTSLFTGLNFTTPILNATTIYYAEAGIGCNSARVQVTVSITNNITPPATVDITRCGAGTVTLNASASQQIYWYDSMSGGNQVGVGTTFTTPSLSTTTTYYVATGDICFSARIPVQAIIGGTQVTNHVEGAICGSGNVVLSATCSQPVDSIVWYDQPGGNVIGVGQYYITPLLASTTTYYVVAASACTGMPTPITAVIFPNLSYNMAGDTLYLQSGTSSTLDAGTGYSSYNWSTNESSQTIIVSTGGWYYITVTDANGCPGTDSIFVDMFTGIGSIEGKNKLEVYPNPTNGQLIITLPETSSKSYVMKLISIDGKVLMQEDVKNAFTKHQQKVISLSRFAAGVYVLELLSDDYSATVKVFLQ